MSFLRKLMFLSFIVSISFVEAAENEKCINFCNDKYNPVCAKRENDVVKFANDCWMGYENCKSDTKLKFTKLPDNEACAKFENTGCAIKCSSEPKEVCAHNGVEYKEFVNNCQMSSANCQNPKSKLKIEETIQTTTNVYLLSVWAVAYYGKCKSTY